MPASENPLDHPAIAWRLFHPRRTGILPTFVVGEGELRLGCHAIRVDPQAGWVVSFHGNGELAAESERYLGRLFTAAGWNACFVEYRGYGASGGRPALAAMLGDGQRVAAALGAPPEKIVAFGRSLGSVYAIEMARRLPALGGLVLESGIASLNDHWKLAKEAGEVGCAPAAIETALAADFDHGAKLSGYSGRLLVLHAAGDRLVVPSNAERLHAWGGGNEKRLVIFPDGDHNSIFFANEFEYSAEVRRFLGRATV
jgi:pimeloyl-ACP methyl ester carboxylesterase